MIHSLDYTGIDILWDDEAGTITSVKSPSYAQKLAEGMIGQFKFGNIAPAPDRPFFVQIKNDPLKNSAEFLACLCAGNTESHKRWNWWKLPPSLNWDMVTPLIEYLPESEFDPEVDY
ncbi:MAG: hypothetical protein QM523_00455 [Candidatus Pacebacteria bacterium]|nr:hypothetical protein [Candidatus Paceibacterota bacterium]